MVVNNTPTIIARRRKPTGRMRLRLETAKKLRKLSTKGKAKSKVPDSHDLSSKGDASVPMAETDDRDTEKVTVIKTRPARVKTGSLRSPPQPSAKFSRRQKDKTWLPTHMFHTKRAKMTPPNQPLWRFAIPLSPTAKCYRTTHRASALRGAIAWDMSYTSTIGLQGPEKSLLGLLKALGVGADEGPEWTASRERRRWLCGYRAWEGWLYERECWPRKPIAPVAIIWCVKSAGGEGAVVRKPDETPNKRKEKRQIILRVHPSAFLHLWEELIRLSKVQKPIVTVEDLRFDVGSIEIAGPAATEALVRTLRPVMPVVDKDMASDCPEQIWDSLGSVTNLATLPLHSLLGFTVSDPRLSYPPRTIAKDEEGKAHERLLQILSSWPIDRTQNPSTLFDCKARLAANRSLPTQSSINRRRSQTDPGSYPQSLPTDPKIPVLLFASQETSGSGMWTVLLPWNCVLPVWSSLMHYPISTGGSVRFGGLLERRQIAFEAGVPWFPGDFPGTTAGALWQADEAKKRQAEWERRPKGKRIEWDSVRLSSAQKGEVGKGWECDWSLLPSSPEAMNRMCAIIPEINPPY